MSSMASCHQNRQVCLPFTQIQQELACSGDHFGENMFWPGHLNSTLDHQTSKSKITALNFYANNFPSDNNLSGKTDEGKKILMYVGVKEVSLLFD